MGIGRLSLFPSTQSPGRDIDQVAEIEQPEERHKGDAQDRRRYAYRMV